MGRIEPSVIAACSESKSQFVMIFSGNVLPANLEIGCEAAKYHDSVVLLHLTDQDQDMKLDPALTGFPVVSYLRPTKGVSWRRFTSVLPIIIFALRKLKFRKHHKNVLVANSLDTLLVCVCISFFCQASVRYVVRDLNRLQLQSGVAAKFVQLLERLLLQRIQMLAVSSSGFYDFYYSTRYGGPVELLENLPAFSGLMVTTRESTQIAVDQSAEVVSPRLTIGYFGLVRYLPPLEKLIQVVEKLNDNRKLVEVRIAGEGVEKLIAACGEKDFVIYGGSFNYSESIASLYEGVDLIYAVYDSSDRNCQVAMPTKFYESLLFKIPILVAKGTLVGREVSELGIGTSVNVADSRELLNALDEAVSSDGWYSSARRALAKNDLPRRLEILQENLAKVAGPAKV
jgi:glycosyltransferase involved in cell wall biosynthesis